MVARVGLWVQLIALSRGPGHLRSCNPKSATGDAINYPHCSVLGLAILESVGWSTIQKGTYRQGFDMSGRWPPGSLVEMGSFRRPPCLELQLPMQASLTSTTSISIQQAKHLPRERCDSAEQLPKHQKPSK